MCAERREVEDQELVTVTVVGTLVLLHALPSYVCTSTLWLGRTPRFYGGEQTKDKRRLLDYSSS